MAKRLSTDAKIVLQNAGYKVEYAYQDILKRSANTLVVTHQNFSKELEIDGGCVDNAEVEELLIISKYWNKK